MSAETTVPTSQPRCAAEQCATDDHRDSGDQIIKRPAKRGEHAAGDREEAAEDGHTPRDRQPEKPSQCHSLSNCCSLNARTERSFSPSAIMPGIVSIGSCADRAGSLTSEADLAAKIDLNREINEPKTAYIRGRYDPDPAVQATLWARQLQTLVHALYSMSPGDSALSRARRSPSDFDRDRFAAATMLATASL